MRARISATNAVLFLALFSPFTFPAADAAPVAGVGVISDNLVIYYDPANPSGVNGTSVYDLSGNSINSSMTKVSSYPQTSTSNGSNFNFNGSGGYIFGSSMSSSNFTAGLSMTFYANFGSQANNFERIMDFGSGSGLDNVLVGREGTGTNFFLEIYNNTTSGTYCRATGAIDSGWHFWAVTVGGGYCKIYKDSSTPITTMAYSILPRNTTWANTYIGKSNWNDAAFEGQIGDFALYSKVLSSSEVAVNLAASTDVTPPSVTGNMIESPENQLSVTTLSLGTGVIYSKLAGLDYSNLTISSAGAVSWLVNPNYEGSGSITYGNFQYPINVRAMDPNGNFVDFVLQVSVTNVVEPSTLSAPSLSATPYKGIAVTITVTPGGDGTAIPGKVTYLIAGKRIPACYKKTYSGNGNSTCTFDPALRGSQEISVTFTPTNTNFTTSTSKKSFFIYKRSTTR